MLWYWFVIPIFHGSVLSISQAIGLGLIVPFLTYDIHDRDSKDKREATKSIARLTVGMSCPIFVVLLGWVVHLFVS